MRIPSWRRPRVRRPDPFWLAQRGDLHGAMPPPYDMSDVAQRQDRQTVEELIERLKPDALDGNTREVLHNLINDWTDQDVAHLNAHRPEYKAVNRILIGLARQEAARRQSRYHDDYGRAQQARQALAVTYQQLTGENLAGLPALKPPEPALGPVRSTLGRLVLPEAENPPAENPEADPTEGARS